MSFLVGSSCVGGRFVSFRTWWDCSAQIDEASVDTQPVELVVYPKVVVRGDGKVLGGDIWASDPTVCMRKRPK